jgi:hypothetical protein
MVSTRKGTKRRAPAALVLEDMVVKKATVEFKLGRYYLLV